MSQSLTVGGSAPAKGELVPLESFSAFGDDANEALSANLVAGQGFDIKSLTHVPFPGGSSTTFEIMELTGPEPVKEIVGALVYYGAGGVLWPTQGGTTRKGTLPVLRTDDLINAYRVGDDLGDIDPGILAQHRSGPETYNWQSLVTAPTAPYGWGSGKDGAGKRAKEYRVLCILRPGDLFPLLVRAQPGSLNSAVQFIQRLTAAGIPYYRAVIGLSLKTETNGAGQEYPQSVFRLVGQLSKDAGLEMKHRYTDAIARSIANVEVENS